MQTKIGVDIPGLSPEEQDRLEREARARAEAAAKARAAAEATVAPVETQALPPDVYERYQAAPAHEQFDIAQKYGYVPKDAVFVPEVTAEQARQAHELAQKVKGAGLETVTERPWGYVTAQQAQEYETSKEKHLADVEDWAKAFISESKAKRETEAAEAIKAKATAESVSKAGTSRYQVDYETGQVCDVTDPRKPQAVVYQVIASMDAVAKAGESTGWWSRVWRMMTPWQEETGETFPEYMKGWPERVKQSFQQAVAPDWALTEEGQALLKQSYEAEQNAPLWAKVLFGSTVNKAEGPDGKALYLPVLAGIPPDVAPVKAGAVKEVVKRAVKTLGPDDVRMSPQQFDKFLRARVANPDLTPGRFQYEELLKVVKQQNVTIDWDRFVKDIGKGKNLDEAARAATRTIPQVAGEGLTVTPGQAAAAKGARALRQAEELDEVKRAIQAFNRSVAAKHPATVRLVPLPLPAKVPSAQVQPAEWQPFRPGDLTPERIKTLIERWVNMKPSAAIREMNESNLITMAAAVAPVQTTKIVSGVKSRQLQQVHWQTSEAVAQALREGQAVKAAALANEALKQQAETAEKVKALVDTQTATQVRPDTRTATQVSPATSTATQVQPATETATQARAATQVSPATETATQTQPATKAATGTRVGTATRTPTPEGHAPGRGVSGAREPSPRGPGGGRIRRRPEETDEQKRSLIQASTGAVAWNMGKLHGQDVWHVRVPPYTDDDHLVVLGKAPKGAHLADGPGSAYRTAQLLSGKPPAGDFSQQHGAVTARVAPTTKGVRIRFSPRTPRISAPAPRISRRTPRLR